MPLRAHNTNLDLSKTMVSLKGFPENDQRLTASATLAGSVPEGSNEEQWSSVLSKTLYKKLNFPLILFLQEVGIKQHYALLLYDLYNSILFSSSLREVMLTCTESRMRTDFSSNPQKLVSKDHSYTGLKVVTTSLKGGSVKGIHPYTTCVLNQLRGKMTTRKVSDVHMWLKIKRESWEGSRISPKPRVFYSRLA